MEKIDNMLKQTIRWVWANPSPNWLYICLSLLCGIFCLVIAYQGLIKFPNGDEGIYLSGGYQLANGQIPHKNYWWPQGIGINIIVASFGQLFGFNLLLFRLLSFICLLCSFAIILVLLKKNINEQHLSPAYCFLVCSSVACQSVIIYNASGLGTKEGIVQLLLVSCVAAYLRLIQKRNINTLSAFFLSVAAIILIKPNLVLGLSFFVVHYVYIGRNIKDLFTGVVFVATVVALVHVAIFKDFTTFGLMYQDLSIVARDIELRGLDVWDALALLWQGVWIILSSILFLVFLFRHLKILKASHPATVFFGYWATNALFSLIIFYPTLFAVYFYQFNFLLLAAILLHVGGGKWNAPPAYVFLMAGLIIFNFQSHLSDKFKFLKFDEAMGYFGSPTIIEHLNGLPHDKDGYLYVGRYQQMVIESVQVQSIYSVGGTVNMDLTRPDRKMANEMRVIALSNFKDLLNKHSLVVLQHYARGKFNTLNLDEYFKINGFKKEVCDKFVCLFVRR